MRKITIELSESGLKRAKEELNQFKKDIGPKLDEICRRLAEIGMQEATLWAQMARGYGNDDVHVSYEKTERGYKVVMSGADIYFVEFGTGIFAGEYPGDTTGVTVGVMPGDYSDTHARQYSTKGYWFYDNVFYRGTPAEMPMYHAGERMKQEMPRIAREVFGK